MNLSEFMTCFLVFTYDLCRTFMMLMNQKIALGEIYNHNLRSISAWRNLCNYAHDMDINIWGSHQASCEPLLENWRANHIEIQLFPSTILSHALWHVWNLLSHHGKDYGLIPIGYQAISWTSPGNLILDTREWSYTADSSIWVVYLGTKVAMLKISSRLQRVNQTSELPTRLSFVVWTLWHTQSMTKAKTYIHYYYCYVFLISMNVLIMWEWIIKCTGALLNQTTTNC